MTGEDGIMAPHLNAYSRLGSAFETDWPQNALLGTGSCRVQLLLTLLPTYRWLSFPERVEVI